MDKSLLTKAFIIKGQLSEPTEAWEDKNFHGLKVTIRRIVMFGRQRVGYLQWPLANQGFDDSLLTDHFVIRELPSEPTNTLEVNRKRRSCLQWRIAIEDF